MIVGIPKERKDQEARVGMTPAGALALIQQGHTVWIESEAGVPSGFEDKLYKKLGCKIAPNIEQVYANSEMIIKVVLCQFVWK